MMAVIHRWQLQGADRELGLAWMPHDQLQLGECLPVLQPPGCGVEDRQVSDGAGKPLCLLYAEEGGIAGPAGDVDLVDQICHIAHSESRLQVHSVIQEVAPGRLR